MTVFEYITKRIENCLAARDACVDNGSPNMAAVWQGKADRLLARRGELTVAEAEAEAWIQR